MSEQLDAAREMVAEATADRVTWRDGTEYISVEDAARLVAQARSEGASEVLWRVGPLMSEGAIRFRIDGQPYVALADLAAALRGDA